MGGGFLRSAAGWPALKAIRATSMGVMGDERILGSSDMGFSDADVARSLNLTLSAVSKLIFRAHNVPALMNDAHEVLNRLQNFRHSIMV